jgi:putative ABC transport system permease protein
MSSTYKQIVAVTSFNLQSLPQRLGASLVVIIGIAGVVAVLISVLAMSSGMIKTMQASGRADRVMVLRNGSITEVGSVINQQAARTVMTSPGIRKTSDGEPVASCELMRLVNLRGKEGDADVSVAIRGIGQNSDLRPEIKIIQGRMFKPSVNELIVGKGIQNQFKNVGLGDKIRTPNAVWTVVGVFTSGGDTHESEVMADASTLASAYGASSFCNTVLAVLESSQTFEQFKSSVTAQPSLSVDVVRESDYFKQQSKVTTRLLSIVAYVVGGIMAAGAIFGALNAMYSAVSTRSREIATLRALGFGATATVVSIVIEAVVLALLGGVIGAAIAWGFFNGTTVSTGATAQGNMVFDLTVSPGLVSLGILWAIAIGLAGGIAPAIRAAKLPVATALREV